MRFDWYQGTIGGKVEGNLDLIKGLKPDYDLVRCRAIHNFEVGYDLTLPNQHPFATFYWGGVNEGLHFKSTGSAAHGFYEGIKSVSLDYKVSRADSALDLVGEGSWDRLYSLCVSIAKARNLRISQVGDYIRGKSRTLYIGSPKSVVYLRLYEKGWEQIDKEYDEGADTTWCRLELQVRPASRHKAKASSYDAESIWGSSSWSNELIKDVSGLSLERLKLGAEYKKPDFEKTFDYVMATYNKSLKSMADHLGGVDQLAKEIIKRLKD